MLANFWKFLRTSVASYLHNFLKDNPKNWVWSNSYPMQLANIMFFNVIYVKLWPDFLPLPLKFNYSSKHTYEYAKHRSITSVDFTYALKAKEAVFSAPLVPRKPNYNSDTVCNEGQEWRIWQNPLKIQKDNLLLWKRKAFSPKGCRPHNQALNLTWYEQFSWCTISVHPRAQTPKQDCSARLRRESAEHPQAQRTPWAGRGSPQIKMDAVSLINLRSGTACAGKRAASGAALLGNQQRGLQTWS